MIRCFQKRVERTLQWDLNRGEMVEKRTGAPHKNLSDLTIHIQMDNKVALSYLLEMGGGGCTQFRAFKNQQVNLCDHNYCRISTKQIECPSRLGVLECQKYFRLKTASKHVSKHNQTFRIYNRGLLCIQAVPSASTICSMEAPSKQHSKRCNWNKMFLCSFFLSV